MTTLDSTSIRKLLECKKPCACAGSHTPPKLIVITGGPGAGKTSFIELARKTFCHHVGILPESAGILFNGGFPRSQEDLAVMAAQKSIWYVMRELELLAKSLQCFHTILCDRGALDGAAYWPEGPQNFFSTLGTTEAQELKRYELAVHMRTPSPMEYEGMNSLRIESSQEAVLLDKKTMQVWSNHPKHVVIEGANHFMNKIQSVFDVVAQHMPPCCS